MRNFQTQKIFQNSIYNNVQSFSAKTMFTGLIEEIGKVRAIKPLGGAMRITVSADKVLEDIEVDDSVALNGVCQTVVAHTKDSFDVEAVEETIRKTTFASFRVGMNLNLERAAKLGDRLGGHLVQGHVDCPGRLINIRNESTGKLLKIKIPAEFAGLIVPRGSICINGISLTIADCETDIFTVAVIPHTWKMTTLAELRTGLEVNLEFDIIGKYVQRLNDPYIKNAQKKSGRSSLDKYINQPL